MFSQHRRGHSEGGCTQCVNINFTLQGIINTHTLVSIAINYRDSSRGTETCFTRASQVFFYTFARSPGNGRSVYFPRSNAVIFREEKGKEKEKGGKAGEITILP